MSAMFKFRLGTALKALVVAAAVLSFAGSDPAFASARKKDSGAGGVTFAARPAQSEFLKSKGVGADRWGFVVELDTHSRDLKGLDLPSLATVRTSRGAQLKPQAWQGLSEDSHHRSGLLLFSAEEARKHGIDPDKPEGLELVLSDVAGVKQRVLRWE